MRSKRRLLRRSRLCVIVDTDFLSRQGIVDTARRAIRGGADMLQLRSKGSCVKDMIRKARILKRLAKRYGVPFIVNDRLDVAISVDADGLHIGQGDVGLPLARAMMGPDKIIGLSVNSLRQAKLAKKRGADYLGIGPVFKTPVKIGKKAAGLGLLSTVKHIGIPAFAIGGIDCGNVLSLTKRGFRRVAVIRAACQAADPFEAAKQLKEALS